MKVVMASLRRQNPIVQVMPRELKQAADKNSLKVSGWFILQRSLIGVIVLNGIRGFYTTTFLWVVVNI